MFFLLPFDSECAGEGVDAHRHGPIGSAFPAAIRAALAGGRLYARRRQNAPDQHLHRRVSGNKCLRTFLLVGIRACVERSPNSSGACIGQNEARRTAGRVWFRCCVRCSRPTIAGFVRSFRTGIWRGGLPSFRAQSSSFRKADTQKCAMRSLRAMTPSPGVPSGSALRPYFLK